MSRKIIRAKLPFEIPARNFGRIKGLIGQTSQAKPSPFPPDDDFMLAVGIQESLKTAQPQNIDYCLPPRPLAKDNPKSTELTETDTRASQSTSDAFSGLSALAKACEDATDTLN